MTEKQIRIRNIKAEILLIKAFTVCKKDGRTAIIERVTGDHFGSKVGKLLWKRVSLLHTNNNLPYRGGWNVLINDPVLHNKQTVQDVLEQFEESEVSGKHKFVLELIKTLEFFRQKRNAYNSIETAYDALAEAEDQEGVSEALVPIIGAARTVADLRTRDSFFRLDTLNLLETLRLSRERRGRKNIARTLWHQFDAINSGFSFGSLITIAATTGGGKSAVAFINMMINFALQGLEVAGASLEMSKDLIAERQAAFVSGIPMHKIRAGKWTPEEEKHIDNSSNLLLELVAKRGGSYWVLKQLEKDSTVTEMLTMLYEKGRHVQMIDYINLLRLPKGRDKWEALGEVAREAKVFADSHDSLVILLAQLNEEERVKYSKAVEEHSDNVIIWSYPPQNRPGFIHAKQIKARNQVPYNFYLVEDFANMRIYDLLEPTGLALMLSRSSGKSYKRKTNEYFGIRRLIEIQDTLDLDSIGVPKHKFINDIDWHALTDKSVPAPNVPDVGVIIDMVREMINFISEYEPAVGKALLDNLKESDILKPYEEFIDDLDLPHNAKVILGIIKEDETSDGNKKQKLLEKIEKDLITATQDMYIEGDKIVNEYRKNDRTTSRKRVYEDTNEQIHSGKDPEKPLRRHKRRKEVIDPRISTSKWLKYNRPYAYRKQMKVDNTISHIEEGGHSPLDAMKAISTKGLKSISTRAKSKGALKAYKKQWKKIVRDEPASPDTLKENMLLNYDSLETSFLPSFNGEYIDKLEHNIETVGYFLEKKVSRVSSRINILIANYFASEGIGCWKKGLSNERKVNSLATGLIVGVTRGKGDLRQAVELDKEKLPAIDEIFSKLKVKNSFKKILVKESRKARAVVFPSPPLLNVDSLMRNGDSKDEGYALQLRAKNGFIKKAPILLDSEKILESPYIILFNKPQFIGSITQRNYKKLCVDAFFASVIKTGVFSRILGADYGEREKLIRSIVWALLNPEYRDNMVLLGHIRQVFLSFIMKMDKNNSLMHVFNENNAFCG